MSVKLTFNTHGKGRVRLVKINRHPDGRQEIQQMNVQILLEGDNMEDSFTHGNNKNIVPTDTCKNTVYCVASKNEFKSIEEFGIILAKHFLSTYPAIVNKVSITITRDIWERLVVPDSRGKLAEHKHAFKRLGPQKPYTVVVGEQRPLSPLSIHVTSGFKSLEILKTTQSSFVDFHKCPYTSLPEVTDRLVGTSADAEWTFSPSVVMQGKVDYNKVYNNIETALIRTFAGPADKGVPSPSVQETLYKMAVQALQVEPSIQEVTLLMPNIHNMVFNLEQYGLKNQDKTGLPFILYPIDEPHGMIKATVARSTHSRL